MASYQDHVLDGASPVELVVALYDGIIRFLYAAIAAVERGDVTGRRIAVKRAMDIIIHLQARLRMDIGGRPAQVLSEYYASMFALILQASQAASSQRFEVVIAHIRNVRDAWRQVAVDPAVLKTVAGGAQPRYDRSPGLQSRSPIPIDSETASSWTA